MEEGVLMALFEGFMVPCTEIRKTRHDDPQGGFYYTWEDGVKFDAAIVKNKTLDAKVAEKEGVKSIYTVTTEKGLGLEFHEVFKRNKDGATFRVTADAVDGETPPIASFQFEQVSAERWELPND